MGRQPRPALPGTPFHITARTQWQEELFTGAEGAIAELIRDSVRYSDAELVAYAVMPNHIHVVLVQGRLPLAGYVQPLLRRIALLVIQRRDRPGHVFAGRYAHRVCQDPQYFRNIVTYVHLNPVRAGICSRPGDYPWSSHRDYSRGPDCDLPPRYALAVEQAVRVFARHRDPTSQSCRRDYRAYVRWRLAMDAYQTDDRDLWQPVPHEPLSTGGDLHWLQAYGTPRSLRTLGADAPPARTTDMRDHIGVLLRELAPELPLEVLRDGGRSRRLVHVRNEVIARSLSAGYSANRLARFLRVSPTTVSHVRSRMRLGVA